MLVTVSLLEITVLSRYFHSLMISTEPLLFLTNSSVCGKIACQLSMLIHFLVSYMKSTNICFHSRASFL